MLSGGAIFEAAATGSNAAVADGRGEPWNFIDFSKAVIADVGPISSLAPIQNSKAVIRGDRSIFASGCRHLQR